jgi:nucleoside-diphosphate-sugar epimerase
MSALAGLRVLVTGGTGFLGSRVVEKLVLEHDARVRVLTSNVAHAARAARFDIELVHGDVGDPALMRHAAEACDVIVHCAYGSSGSDRERRRVTVDGTRAVLDAALAARVQRVVHVSTMVVYGIGVEGVLDERAPRRRTGVGYADTKSEAEALVERYVREHGAPVAIVQPTAIYGPYAPSWTERVVEAMRTRRLILVDGGTGLANPVYIDDVADALLLAAVRDEAVGEAFLVASGERVTWRDFLGRYETMLGEHATVTMTRAEARAYYVRQQRRTGLFGELSASLRRDAALRKRVLKTREVDALARLARPLLANRVLRPLAQRLRSKPSARVGSTPRTAADLVKPIQAEHPKQVAFLAAKTEVSIDKARRLLGFEPAFDLDAGMALTEAYLRWANRLPTTEG